MRIHVTLLTSNEYFINAKKKKVRLMQLGHLIREGHTIDVRQAENDIDITNETLVRLAFNGKLSQIVSGDFSLIDILAEIVDEDFLYEIIESGGADNYILKKRRFER